MNRRSLAFSPFSPIIFVDLNSQKKKILKLLTVHYVSNFGLC